MLIFEVDGDKIVRRDDTKTLYAGSKEYIECKFTFSAEYEGTEKYAAFLSPYNAYHQRLVDDTCYVPADAMAKDWLLKIGVFAIKDGCRISTGLTSIQVGEGAYNGETPPVNDPDIYEQLFEVFAAAITIVKVNNQPLVKEGREVNVDLTPYSEKDDIDRTVRHLLAKLKEQETQEITIDEIDEIISGIQ